jgi:hypothetical protein
MGSFCCAQQQNVSLKEKTPHTYSEFKSLFKTIEFENEMDIRPSFCLSKKSKFYPYSEESYEVMYPLGVITNYRGLDIFTIEVKAQSLGGAEWGGTELWVFKDEIYKTAIGLTHYYSDREWGYNLKKFVFTKDTLLLVRSFESLWGQSTELALEITSEATTKYRIDFNDSINYHYDDRRILRVIEFSDLRYTSPYFSPEKAILWEQNYSYPLYPTMQEPYRFYPPENATAAISCWFYIIEENGKYTTVIVSKDKQGSEISKMTISSENGQACSYTIKNSNAAEIEVNNSDIKNPAIIETAIGNVILESIGKLIKE